MADNTDKRLTDSLAKSKWVIFLIGFLLYSPTFFYDYALDDKIMVVGNQITKKGFDGISDQFKYDSMDGFWAEEYGVPVEDLNKAALVSGGRYRPLTMATHSIEWEFFGENPGVSHFVNALLYGLSGLLIFLVLNQLFNFKEETWWKGTAFIIAILYLVHPLHVEAVANIKGRDEILSFLFALWAWYFHLKDSSTKGKIISAGLLFLGLLSKESVIAFVALIPLADYFFRNAAIKNAFQSGSIFLGAALFYIFIRFSVLGTPNGGAGDELMNDPFLLATTQEKWGSIFVTVLAYIKLHVLPHPLTHDYYPFHLPFVTDEVSYPSISHPASLGGILITLGILFLAFKNLVKKTPWSYGLWFFAGAFILVSNVFFPLGVFMNERFMYIGSLGLILSAVLFVKSKFTSSSVTYIYYSVAAVFVLLTLNRQPAWENDTTLSLTDVVSSSGSAKAHMGAGQALIQEITQLNDGSHEKNDLIQTAFEHLKTSLEIYPQYFAPLDLLGQLYYESGNYAESLKYFGYCADRKPGDDRFSQNMIYLGNKLIQEQRFQEANDAYLKALSYRPNDVELLGSIAENYGKNLQNPNASLQYLLQANNIQPNNAGILQKIGIVNAMQGNLLEAERYFKRALQLTPNDSLIVKNLAITLQQLGRSTEAQAYFTTAAELEAQGQK